MQFLIDLEEGTMSITNLELRISAESIKKQESMKMQQSEPPNKEMQQINFNMPNANQVTTQLRPVETVPHPFAAGWQLNPNQIVDATRSNDMKASSKESGKSSEV